MATLWPPTFNTVLPVVCTVLGGQCRRKRGDDDAKSRKKKLRSLPTFASYEDYAKLIDDEPEDNI